MLSQIMELDQKYFMPVFGERFHVCFTRGEDVYLFDTENKRYTDFLAGIAVNCLGYSDQGFKQALTNQVENLIHTSNYFYIESQAKAAKKLCQATGMGKAFFSNSGAEAVEGALKLARKYFYSKEENKFEVIAMNNSFHGRTLATLSATGQEQFQTPYKPLMPSFIHVDYNDIDAVRAAVTPKTCAVLMEPVIGEGGVIPAKPEYLKQVRQLCDEQGILLIFDEVQTGMGRTGQILCAQKHGIQPDIVVLAKALGNGVPIGAFLATDKIASAYVPGDHGSTFGGNHLATTAALYVTTKLMETDLLGHVRDIAGFMHGELEAFTQSHPDSVTEMRCEGLMFALELKEELSPKAVAKKMLKQGFVIGTAGHNSLRFLPPYIIQKEHVLSLVSALDQIL